jgi:hypothetical protein
VILTQHPRPSTSSPQCAVSIPDATAGRFNVPTCERSTVFALTPYRSQPYKCPLPQPLSFDNHTNARGVGGALALLHSFVALCIKSVAQLLSNQALPHSFSKLPGCHPTIPILARPELQGERVAPRCHSPNLQPSNLPTCKRSFVPPVTCPKDVHPMYYWSEPVSRTNSLRVTIPYVHSVWRV